MRRKLYENPVRDKRVKTHSRGYLPCDSAEPDRCWRPVLKGRIWCARHAHLAALRAKRRSREAAAKKARQITLRKGK
jgi:hypothetical protein